MTFKNHKQMTKQTTIVVIGSLRVNVIGEESWLLCFCCFVMYVLFVCVEVLRPSQPNGVMSSVVSLPNHTFTGQA